MLSTVEQQPAINKRERTFEGWAIVDVLGHQRHVGYVTTEYFGQTAFFRVMTPARDPRERIVDGNEYVNFKGCSYPPAGSKVFEEGRPGGERFIGAASVYALTPATKERVMELAEDIDTRAVVNVTDPEGKPIAKPTDDDIPW
jgi:hypothetical protein